MALTFTDQRRNNTKKEEPKQEEVDQGLKEGLIGANGMHDFGGGEGADGSAGGGNMGNTEGDESAGRG
jgi:hypothetical protein